MDSFRDLTAEQKKDLLDFLTGFISENKKNKFREIILQRTRHIALVLEDIFQPHNASAVLRTCDCFGIQDVHIIENHNKYQVNPDVALGSSKWLTLKKYDSSGDNTVECLQFLKNSGYRIVATTPHKDGCTPESLPLDQKIALVFGTELEGLTSRALEMSDEFVRIPMYGFTESLNISVSAALLIRSLTERMRNSGIRWQIPEAESLDIRIEWAKNTVRKSGVLEKDFIRKLRR